MGDPPGPGGPERTFDDADALIGMDQAIRTAQEPGVLDGSSVAPAEQHHIAGRPHGGMIGGEVIELEPVLQLGDTIRRR